MAKSLADVSWNPYKSREEELGDPGRSYGGGRLDQAAVQAARGGGGQGPNLPGTIPYTSGQGERLELPSGGQLYEVSSSGQTLRPLNVIGTRDLEQGGGRGPAEFEPDLRLAANAVPRGGLGVTQPVHVIRGMRSTYAGGAPGEEWLSLSRAAQGINRFLGAGEYVSPEVAKAEALALRDPRKLAEGEAIEGARAQQLFERKLLGEFGVPDKDDPTKLVLPGQVQKLAYQTMPTKLADVDKAIASIKPGVEVETRLQLFSDPAKGKAARDAILGNYLREMRQAGQTPDQATINYINTRPVTKENLEWFTQQHDRAKKAGGAVPSPTKSPGAPAGKASIRAGKLSDILRDKGFEGAPEMRVFGEPSLNMPTETPGGTFLGNIVRGIQARREAVGFSQPAREEERLNLSRLIPKAM